MNAYALLSLVFFPLVAFSEDKWIWQNPLPQGNSLEAVAFTSPTVGFAVGEDGTVVNTVDGGGSWQLQNVGFEDLKAIDFPTQDIGYVVGDRGTLLKTVDAGKHWTLKSTGVTTDFRALDFVDASVGFVVGDSGTLLKTEDGGDHWTPWIGMTEVPVSGISFANQSVGYACAEGGSYFKTIDGGKTWTKSVLNDGLPIKIHFASPDTGYIVQDTALYKTTNGGAVWRQMLSKPRDNRLRSAHFENAETIHFLLADNTSLMTINGGETWVTAPGYPQNAIVRAVFFIGMTTGYGVGAGGFLMKTVDGGQIWTVLSSSAGIDDVGNYFSGISFPNPSTGYVTTRSTLYKTQNAGTTWSKVHSNPGKISYCSVFLNTETGFVGGGIGTERVGFLDKTMDGGKTWMPQTIWNVSEALSMAFPTAATGYVMGRGFALKTGDGGLSWVNLPLPQNPGNLEVTIYAMHFLDPDLGYIISGSTLFKTMDGGRIWDSLPLYHDPAVFRPVLRCVYFLDKNTGFVGTESQGIFKTVNGGRDWKRTDTTVNPSPAMDIRFVTPQTGYAVGNWIQKSDDGGDHWKRLEVGASGKILGVVFPDTLNGYAAGIGNGIGDTPAIYRINRSGGSAVAFSRAAKTDIRLGAEGELIYRLGARGRIRAVLFNAQGKRVATLVDEFQNPGEHRIYLPSKQLLVGAYFLEFVSGGTHHTLRAIRR